MSVTPRDAETPAATAPFVPVRSAELTAALCLRPELSEEDRAAFGRFASLTTALFHVEYGEWLDELKAAYSPFDPDSDTIPVFDARETEQERYFRLFARFSALLERANFRRLTPLEIQSALQACSDWGLNLDVDFRAFDRLEVYARGDQHGSRWRRRWRTFNRAEEVSVPIYQRLVVMFRLREDYRDRDDLDTHDVFIKLFKDIPQADLEMLLPASQVRMTLFDQTRIALPTASGLAIAVWKMLTGAVAFAAAGFYGALAILGLVGGTVGYGIRSFFGYLQTKQKYQLSLTESLYYQNLDNNAGVMFRLLNEAEEQETRETLLAYFFLWRAGEGGLAARELDAVVQEYLERLTGREIDFEVDDGLVKLLRWKLASVDSSGRYCAASIDQAIDRLTQEWRLPSGPTGAAASVVTAGGDGPGARDALGDSTARSDRPHLAGPTSSGETGIAAPKIE